MSCFWLLSLPLLYGVLAPCVSGYYSRYTTPLIPVVMILDHDYQEVAWWGPRPQPLQEFFLKEIKPLPKEERFPKVRAWFARDRGRTTMKEILGLIPV